MKTISKILAVVTMVFITTNLNAQSISKTKALTSMLNPWKIIVSYREDPGSTNYYLLSAGNEKYGKKRDGSYFETYGFFGTAEEIIEFIEEIKITRRLEGDETCSLQSKIAQDAGCYAVKNTIYYNSMVSGSTVYLEGYSFVMKEKYMDALIDKIKKFEDESKRD